MSRKSLILMAVVIVIAIIGVIVWRDQEFKAKAAKIESEILRELTAEDIDQILMVQSVTDAESVEIMKESPEARQVFLKRLRNTFALAAEARREGLADEPNFKVINDYNKNLILKGLYLAKASKEHLREILTPEVIKAVWQASEVALGASYSTSFTNN